MNDYLRALTKYALIMSQIIIIKLVLFRLITFVFPVMGMFITPIFYVIIALSVQKYLDWSKRWYVFTMLIDIFFSIKVMNNNYAMIVSRWIIIPVLTILFLMIIIVVIIFLILKFIFNLFFYDVLPFLTRYSFGDIFQLFLQLLSSFLDVSVYLYNVLDNTDDTSNNIHYWGMLPFNVLGFLLLMAIFSAPYISILIYRHYRGDFMTSDYYSWKKTVLHSIVLVFNIYAMIHDMIHGGSIVMDFLVVSILGFSFSIFTFRFT